MNVGEILTPPLKFAGYRCPFCGCAEILEETYRCGFSGIWTYNYTAMEVKTICVNYQSPSSIKEEEKCICEVPVLMVQGCRCGGK